METNSVFFRLKECIFSALPKGLKTAWWLIKITVPVSFGVMLLDYFGILLIIARYTGPMFEFFGLPGVSAVVFITPLSTNIYSVVALLAMFNLPLREGTILAVMCLISHGFLIETMVLKRTGSSALRMLFLRLAGSFLIAWLLNTLMPGSYTNNPINTPTSMPGFGIVFMHWLSSISSTVIKILLLVNILLVFQQIIEEFGWIKAINKPLLPLMRLMGLPENATLSWVVGNLVGLAYGSAIMIDQREKGNLSGEEADLLNHHIAVSHSMLEDPLLFLTLGFTLHWLIWPRILLAYAAVWVRRFELWMKSSIKNRKTILDHGQI
ncbi:MAG: nucleoside recognition protein [Lentimicrobium sp.]|nr:nucleoside recognition protein [Lentimicrobium sp.]